MASYKLAIVIVANWCTNYVHNV